MAIRAGEPSRRTSWLVFGIILFLVLIGAAIWAFVALRSQPTYVVRRDVTLSVGAEGQAIAPPSARADVMATYTAPVERVNATVGGRVRQGDVLVELYYPSVEAAQQQAQLQVQQAQQDYNNARSLYAQNLAQAKQELTLAQAEVRQARQAQAQAQPAQPTGEANLPQPKAIFIAAPGDAYDSTPQVIPEATPAPSPSLEQALAHLQTAQADYQQAQQEMQTALAPYQQQLTAAQLALTQAKAGARGAQIRAPISGTVLVLNALPGKSIGGTAEQQQLVARIVDLSRVQVSVPLSDEQASLVKPRLPAALIFDELPNETYQGTVDHLTTQQVERAGGLVNKQQTMALISFDNRPGRVRPDMQAHATIIAEQVRNVLAVPNAAVTTDDRGRPVIYVRRGNAWAPRPVQVGLRGNDYTEIISGVQEGDIVRTSAIEKL